MKTLPLLMLPLILLSACASMQRTYSDSLASRGIAIPHERQFESCRGYGCKIVEPITLSDKDWDDIHALFTPAPKSAKEERTVIAKAIGLFETKVGAINGTKDDIQGTFIKLGVTQQDCTDESINTTTYLILLQQENLIPRHNVQPTTDRIPLLHYMGRWPHKTAVVQEIETQDLYAVDSWFHNNGRPAEIINLSEWRAGWRPENIQSE